MKMASVPQGVPLGMRAVLSKGINKSQCSFVTIAAAVRASGLPNLGIKKKDDTSVGHKGVWVTYSNAVFVCTATHLPPAPI